MTIRHIIGATVASILLASSLLAQDSPFERGSHDGERRSWGHRSGDRAARFEGLLRSMDANGNGVLEPSEIPEERRGIFMFMASRAGIDPNQPVVINQAVQNMSARFGGGSTPPGNLPPGVAPPPGSAPPGSPPATPGATATPQSPGATEPAKATSSQPPLVPGFGVSQSLPAVPGFGELALATSSPDAASSADPRYRTYAEGVLRRYDSNQNGVLDKDEWGQMRRDPTAADRDQDGRITLDELAIWLAERGRQHQEESPGPGDPPGPGGWPRPEGLPGPGGWPPPGDGSGESQHAEASEASPSASPAAAIAASPGRKSYRFLSAKERLPAGLPDWFTTRDANGDGQLSMAEYAGSWSDGTIQEFGNFDLNADGIVTAKECIKAASSGGAALASAGQPTQGKPSVAPVAAATVPTAVPATPPTASPTSSSPPASSASGSSKPWWMTP
jgi:hypothetical protein